jgi:hypothetical protein
MNIEALLKLFMNDLANYKERINNIYSIILNLEKTEDLPKLENKHKITDVNIKKMCDFVTNNILGVKTLTKDKKKNNAEPKVKKTPTIKKGAAKTVSIIQPNNPPELNVLLEEDDSKINELDIDFNPNINISSLNLSSKNNTTNQINDNLAINPFSVPNRMKSNVF